MKRYRSGVKKQLSLIKKIKKNSKYDLGEDSLYIALLESIPVEFKAYEKQIESFLNDQKVLTDYLNDERKILRRMSALLRRDDIQEKRRHSSYSRYRKRIQSAENIYLKLLERKIEVIQKAYHYTLRHRGLEKE